MVENGETEVEFHGKVSTEFRISDCGFRIGGAAVSRRPDGNLRRRKKISGKREIKGLRRSGEFLSCEF